jgi:hypothetical protein
MSRRFSAWTARYAAVFVVTMSNLMLELLLTRIFSATMFYHFAFMAVSVALFGTAVGAVAVHVAPRHFRADDGGRLAARYALLYGGAVVVCTALQLRLNVTFGSSWRELVTLATLYVLIAVPFILCGIFTCLVLLGAADRVGVVYCADLLGAGAGCALFVPFMAGGEGPRLVLLLGALAVAGGAAMALAAADRVTARVATLALAVCVIAFIARLDRRTLQVQWAEGQRDGVHEFETWNAFSRLTVGPRPQRAFAWGFGTRFSGDDWEVAQKALKIDSAATTVLTAFDGDFEKVPHLRWDVTALAHAVRAHGPVLVMGVGGGRDVLTALAFGHQRVVGVEVNRDILGLLRGPFGDFTGHLGERAGVELVADEARSYLARSPERFEIIQASLVDTWAAAANGAYVLAENSLYTQQAFRLFLDHLTPDGFLSVSRWYFKTHPGETLRLVALAAAVLRERGAVPPEDHLFLARGHSVATLLVGARPLTADDLQRLHAWCVQKGFDELLHGGMPPSLWTQLAATVEPRALLRASAVDLSAPTDDRPFFFNMLRLRDAFTRSAAPLDVITGNTDAVRTLGWLFAITVVLSALFVLTPLWSRRSAGRAPPAAASRMVYFAALGVGFIMIEVSQMQRLMISLGHPVYGLTVVLVSLLVAAGLGSLWTQRAGRAGRPASWLLRALLVLLLTAIVTAAATAALAAPLVRLPSVVRIVCSVGLLGPLGFLLGMPLASGLALSAGDPDSYRALYWGVNGATSVCGSVLAMMVSLSLGITVTYGFGVLAYLLATGAAAVAFDPVSARV